MKIQESWFYKLSDILEDGNIEIAADLQVSIFDDLSQKQRYLYWKKLKNWDILSTRKHQWM